MSPNKLYTAIADFVGTFISHHKPGPLVPEDILILGSLVSLGNISQDNDNLRHWKEIEKLADQAINLIEEQSFRGMVGGYGVPTDKGHGSEVCKPANKVPDPPDPEEEEEVTPKPADLNKRKLTHGEIILISGIAHELRKRGKHNLSFRERDLVSKAICEPRSLTLESLHVLQQAQNRKSVILR